VGEQLAARMACFPFPKWGGVSGCARAPGYSYRQKSLNLSGASSVYGVLNVLVPEPRLQCRGIMAGIGQRGAAAVPQHVRVNRAWHLGPLSDPSK